MLGTCWAVTGCGHTVICPVAVRLRDTMQMQEPSGEVPDVKVSGSQGVQVGPGNQYNNWAPKPLLDPVALGALNPHVAVARLQRESHDELVDFFARASPGDVSEIIDTMSHVDVEKLTTVLADINRRKATELIEGSPLDPILFGSLPEASEAISRKAVIWGWTEAGSVQVWAQGYSRSYNQGNVFWRSTDGGTWAIQGAIGR
jgi:hypothetical protein